VTRRSSWPSAPDTSAADVGRHGHLVPLPGRGHGCDVSEPLIERDEVAALLFNVSDIAELARRLLPLLGDDDGEEEEEAD
jgi:hypothetical protein